MDRLTNPVYWQAHRGGGAYEAPDNTMGANLYAWKLGGIPEADLRTTSDGVIVCLHDSTPARTTDAPDHLKDKHISEITFAETKEWNAGIKFPDSFAKESIPSLEEVFQAMTNRPERLIYLDLKEVDLHQLGQLIDQYEVNQQVIFTHSNLDNCIRMKEIAAGVRTMLWIGGNSQQIQDKFYLALNSEFRGLDQVQLHLKGYKPDAGWSYDLDLAFIQEAAELTSQFNVELEVFPFQFDNSAIHTLLEMGIRWYATDEPAKFVSCL